MERVRYPYGEDTDLLSEETALYCATPSMTQQQFKEECDINVICERFGITGELPVNGRTSTFGDFTGVNDFQSAMNAIREAEEAFMALPGLVRERFGQDPQQFVEFCSDARNLDEMRKLGLAVPLPEAQEGVKSGAGASEAAS